MNKSQYTDHVVIEIRMTRTLNEDCLSIFTPEDPLKRGRQKKRQKRVKEGFQIFSYANRVFTYVKSTVIIEK